MSELEMECVEEELEPWQKSFPQINLTEEDDDEPIFVGVVCIDSKPMIIQWKSEEKTVIRQSNPQPSTGPSSLLPISVVGPPSVPAVPAISPQPIIVNNQGFIVTPQIANSNFVTSLGTPGTSFTFVSGNPFCLKNKQYLSNSLIKVFRTIVTVHFICIFDIFLFQNCKPTVIDEGVALALQQFGDGKRIMLVGEFYYGKFEGDGYTPETERAVTFKCQSCLKVLKNNIRFMNHMKHHLELEKQNSESFESHTTCHHCYRQYLTPFQLQCHIESAHSSIDSTTNCKICELAFESEQVLLDHMKNNHKPGEMPYVCQVCNFRSSFFSDVETHFRDAHANTKDLLCPFCLKVVKSGHIYMQHYMKHQKKGIFRCGKCRLNFLSFKEKVEHRTQVHKTFRKPEALEGLPTLYKVTIRASLTGKPSLTPSWHTPFGLIVTSDTPQTTKPTKSPNVQKSQLGNSGPGKSNASKKKQKRGTSKHNLALKNFRWVKEPSGKRYICIECNGSILDFFSHFPMLLHCGACKYKTNCKKSIGNHMIRFHSTISKSRFSKENGKYSSSLKLTLLCLKCDLMDTSGGNRMTKHLTKRPNHRCKVIQDKGSVSLVHIFSSLPIEQAEDLKSTMTEMPDDQDETLSITGVTTPLLLEASNEVPEVLSD
uniref:C2H2-type domain-containing protein n=1 Tax=Periophthalmus magnuspinnatus TaxID=409849 RepID=A0A3B3ZGP3_9GOBI